MENSTYQSKFPKIGTKIALKEEKKGVATTRSFILSEPLRKLLQIEKLFMQHFTSLNIEHLLLFNQKEYRQFGNNLAYVLRESNLKYMDMYEMAYDKNKPVAAGKWEYDPEKGFIELTEIHSLEAVESEFDVNGMGQDFEPFDLIRYILRKNIFTPLLIERKGLKLVISKYNRAMKDRGELYDYERAMIRFFEPGTIFYPIDLNGRIQHLFVIQPNVPMQLMNDYVTNFLRFLKTYINMRFNLAFSVQASKGFGIYEKLSKHQSLKQHEYSKKGLVFFDIFEYSKLSLKIVDPDLSEEKLEATKSMLLYSFHYVVTRVIEQFHPLIIDKIVGDQVMVVLDPNPSIENPEHQIQELSQRTFLLCWNIALALRFVNRELHSMFEKRDINIMEEEVFRRLMRENRHSHMRIKLLDFSFEEDKPLASKHIDIPMEIILNYYHLLKRYQISNGIECRIGMNVGECLEIFLGGSRLDHTFIGREVDLAARMESLGKRNTVKMPRYVYEQFSKKFKSFIVNYVIEESQVKDKSLTHKMIFITKREYPKGSKPIGTVEFSTNVGYFFRTAQEYYNRLEDLFLDLEPKRLEKRVDAYIQNNQFSLVEKLRKANVRLQSQSGSSLVEQMRTTPSIRRQIEAIVRKDIDMKITLTIKELRNDREAYRLVRNLVLNKDRELYRYYFIDRNLMSVPRKRKYFMDQLIHKFSNKINFELVSKDDLDQIIADLYKKTYGKSE